MCKTCKSSFEQKAVPVSHMGRVMQHLGAGEVLVSIPSVGVITALVSGVRHVRPQSSVSVIQVGGQWAIA